MNVVKEAGGCVAVTHVDVLCKDEAVDGEADADEDVLDNEEPLGGMLQPSKVLTIVPVAAEHCKDPLGMPENPVAQLVNVACHVGDVPPH